MNKYVTKLAATDKSTEAELTSETKALINGKEYKYDYKFINDNVLVLRIGSENYFITLSSNEEEGYLEINLNSRVYNVFCKSELEILTEKLSNGKADNKVRKEIYSPMPGIIRKLNVSNGQEVAKGEVMFVLEAMKMENEIKATRDCVIKKVNIEELKSVEKNELLLILE